MVGQVAAADTDGMYLGHIFGRGHQHRHRPERPSRIIHIQTRHDHPNTAVGQLAADIHDAVIEKLGLVDPDNVDIGRHQQDVSRRFDRR